MSEQVQALRDCLVDALDTHTAIVAATGRASLNVVPARDLGDAPALPVVAYTIVDLDERAGAMVGDARATVRFSCYAVDERTAADLSAAVSAALNYNVLASATPAIDASIESRSRTAPAEDFNIAVDAYRADFDVTLLFSVVTSTLAPVAQMFIATPPTVTYLPLPLVLTMQDALGNPIDPATRVVSWGSQNPAIAKVSPKGIVTAVSAGTVDIVAICEGIEVREVVTVQALAYLVTATPTSFSLLHGQTQQLTVVARDVLGNILTGRVTTFVPADPTVATVSATGLVTAQGTLGSTTILIDVEGAQTVVGIAIQPAVASVVVTPSPVSIGIGSSVQMVSVEKDAGNNVLVGRTVVWSSSDPTKVSIDAVTGIALGVALGAVTITATSEGIQGTSAASAVGNGPYGIVTLASAWWKRDTLTALANNAAVSAWADSSPNGVNLVKTAGAGAAPVWDTGVLGGSVKFTGTGNNTQLENAAWTAYLDSAHLTVFAVARWDGTTNQGGRTIVRTGGSFSSIGSFLGFYGANTTQNFYIGGGGANNLSNFPFSDITNPHIFEACYDGTQVSNAAKQKLLLDGTVETVTFGGTLPGTLGHADASGIVLAGGSGTNSALMHIAEVIVFVGTLSAADRSQIRVALGAKYGIAVTP